MGEKDFVYEERFKYQDEKINAVKDEVVRVNSKVDDAISSINTQIKEVNGRVHSLENTATNRLTQIESKFDMYNNLTQNQLSDIQKKMDSLIVNKNSKPSKAEDSFKEYLVKKGLQIIDVAIYGGVLYAIAKGVKIL